MIESELVDLEAALPPANHSNDVVAYAIGRVDSPPLLKDSEVKMLGSISRHRPLVFEEKLYEYDKRNLVLTRIKIQLKIQRRDADDIPEQSQTANSLLVKMFHEAKDNIGWAIIVSLLPLVVFCIAMSYICNIETVSSFKMKAALTAVWLAGISYYVTLFLVCLIGKEGTISAVLAKYWNRRSQLLNLTSVTALMSVGLFVFVADNGLGVGQRAYQTIFSLSLLNIASLMLIHLVAIPKLTLALTFSTVLKPKIVKKSSLLMTDNQSLLEMITDSQADRLRQCLREDPPPMGARKSSDEGVSYEGDTSIPSPHTCCDKVFSLLHHLLVAMSTGFAVGHTSVAIHSAPQFRPQLCVGLVLLVFFGFVHLIVKTTCARPALSATPDHLYTKMQNAASISTESLFLTANLGLVLLCNL